MTFLIITILVVVAVLIIATFTQFKLTNEAYDRLKWLVIRWSVIVTFIGVIVKTFDIPYGTETVTVVAAIGALLSGLLGISSYIFYTNGEQNKFNEDTLVEMLEVSDEEKNDLSK